MVTQLATGNLRQNEVNATKEIKFQLHPQALRGYRCIFVFSLLLRNFLRAYQIQQASRLKTFKVADFDDDC